MKHYQTPTPAMGLSRYSEFEQSNWTSRSKLKLYYLFFALKRNFELAIGSDEESKIDIMDSINFNTNSQYEPSMINKDDNTALV